MLLFQHALDDYSPAGNPIIDIFTCSDLRQVPDHQEVYLDKEGFTSISFDILERVEPVADGGEALRYHLEDITETEGQRQVLSSGSVKFLHLPCVQCLSTPTRSRQR